MVELCKLMESPPQMLNRALPLLCVHGQNYCLNNLKRPLIIAQSCEALDYSAKRKAPVKVMVFGL